MSLDSAANIKSYALNRVDELTDGSSDWDSLADDLLIKRWRDLVTRHPWIGLTKNPPGVFLLTAAITTLTLTVAAAGTGVAATLSAVYASSLTGYKIRPSGLAWAARITAHTAGTAALTLDAAPETVTAGTACTIFQDEYDLASDLGLFKNGLWTQDGDFVELVDTEKLLANYPDPPESGYPPREFCRLTQTRIRLSSYPTAAKRVEYPYTYVPSDPSGTSTLAIPSHLRPILGELLASDLFDQKRDSRVNDTLAKAEAMIQAAIGYETRLRLGQGQLSHVVSAGPYSDTKRRYARAGW